MGLFILSDDFLHGRGASPFADHDNNNTNNGHDDFQGGAISVILKVYLHVRVCPPPPPPACADRHANNHDNENNDGNEPGGAISVS